MMLPAADWGDFLRFRMSDLVNGYGRAVLKVIGRLHVPERTPPPVLPFDRRGFLVLPEGWREVELPPLTLTALPRDHHHLLRIDIPLEHGEHYGQAAFEDALTLKLPYRLPQVFSGHLQLELRAKGRVAWRRELEARVGCGRRP